MDELAESQEPTKQPESPDADALQQGCLTRLTPVTPPGCAGCLTAIFLALAILTAATAFFLDPNSVPWRHAIRLLRQVQVNNGAIAHATLQRK